MPGLMPVCVAESSFFTELWCQFVSLYCHFCVASATSPMDPEFQSSTMEGRGVGGKRGGGGGLRGGVRGDGGGGGGGGSEGGEDLTLLQCEVCRKDFPDTRDLFHHVEGLPGDCLRTMGLTSQEWRARFTRRQRRARHLRQVSAYSSYQKLWCTLRCFTNTPKSEISFTNCEV